ncbi:cytochrome d ubiquinol oxidase subunit II [Bordetella sp. BOR01]|uniref:cytochrome d ubiquinol oxidase subunit II n=1 Tax=Bordetella sp. BOR01 TaxID=2854779 RepID=UPI001C48ABC5|nr:cytochrome d ubiquinol oxidase subunit II [Bordetella sp. BOR01]MBV7483844.1 cytochrome d ubiquinol oxidase subunit II [Bordetella sp. BOR01]
MNSLAAYSGGLAANDPAFWLPLVFMGLMGFAVLAYVLLDGFDLGVGILLTSAADDEHRTTMLASIGTFWDANETWLVLGIGILLVAFPFAYGGILRELYFPVTLMLFGLILRGVAFDFRAKAPPGLRVLWTRLFCVGSVVAAWSQGYILGGVVTGHNHGIEYRLFSVFVGACVVAGYAQLGAAWLIMKTEGDLQRQAVRWARRAWWGLAAGIVAVSLVTPLMDPQIWLRWTSVTGLYLAPLPLATLACLLTLAAVLRTLPRPMDKFCWAPFALTAAIFTLAFLGLAVSLFPWLLMGRITLWQGAAAPGSLKLVLVGACVVLPVIIAYNAYSYRVFWGKTATALSYDGPPQ